MTTDSLSLRVERNEAEMFEELGLLLIALKLRKWVFSTTENASSKICSLAFGLKLAFIYNYLITIRNTGKDQNWIHL